MDLNESIEWIRQRANEVRFQNEVWLNVQLTTWERRLGFTESVHSLDLVETTRKYREAGVIK